MGDNAATAEIEKFLSGKKENDVWDVYNTEAKKEDVELVKDWRDNLNSLLIFAAIFAAVLTAFVIESKKKLEPDPTEILLGLATTYFQNINNLSHANFTTPKFSPSHTDISINCLLFASLGTSLFAAFASVVALQWVADYDAAITRGGSSPEDYAKRRQFRYGGILSWKMQEIIAALPLLIYASVALFWAGSTQWIWSLHHTVGYVVMGSTALALAYYAVTTALSAIFITSPFRTPLSRGIYWSWQQFLATVYKLFLAQRTRGISAEGHSSRYNRLRSWFRRNRVWLQETFKLRFWSSLVWLQEKFKSLRVIVLHPLPALANWIETDILPNDTAIRREDLAVSRDQYLKEKALCWLAHRLPISPDANRRLGLLLIGVVGQLAIQSLSPRFSEAPWWPILNFFGWHYIRRVIDGTLTEDDREGIRVLLRLTQSEEFWLFCRPKEHEDDFFEVGYGKRGGVQTSRRRQIQGRLDINAAFLLQVAQGPTSLLELHVPKTILQVIMKSPYSDVQWEAASALKASSESVELEDAIGAAIPRLIALLQDLNWRVRLAAIVSLGNMVKHVEFRDAICASIPCLIKLLQDHGQPVREAAVTSLGKMVQHAELRNAIVAAVPPIIELLQDPNSYVQKAAVSSFGEMVQHAEFRDAIVAAGPRLIELLQDPDSDVQWAAVASITEMVQHAELRNAIGAAVPPLIELLQDPDSDLRSAAIVSLGKMSKQAEFRDAIVAAGPRLIELLQDPNSYVRRAAVASITEMVQHAELRNAIGAAVPPLIELLQGPDSDVQKAVVSALGEIVQHAEFRDAIVAAGPRLIELLQDPDSYLRSAAIVSLGKMMQHAERRDTVGTVVLHLVTGLQDSDGKVQWAAANSLGELAKYSELPYLTSAVIPHLIVLLWEDDESLRECAASALGKVPIGSRLHAEGEGSSGDKQEPELDQNEEHTHEQEPKHEEQEPIASRLHAEEGEESAGDKQETERDQNEEQAHEQEPEQEDQEPIDAVSRLNE